MQKNAMGAREAFNEVKPEKPEKRKGRNTADLEKAGIKPSISSLWP